MRHKKTPTFSHSQSQLSDSLVGSEGLSEDLGLLFKLLPANFAVMVLPVSFPPLLPLSLSLLLPDVGRSVGRKSERHEEQERE